jgi:hypothetical protein
MLKDVGAVPAVAVPVTALLLEEPTVTPVQEPASANLSAAAAKEDTCDLIWPTTDTWD